MSASISSRAGTPAVVLVLAFLSCSLTSITAQGQDLNYSIDVTYDFSGPVYFFQAVTSSQEVISQTSAAILSAFQAGSDIIQGTAFNTKPFALEVIVTVTVSIPADRGLSVADGNQRASDLASTPSSYWDQGWITRASISQLNVAITSQPDIVLSPPGLPSSPPPQMPQSPPLQPPSLPPTLPPTLPPSLPPQVPPATPPQTPAISPSPPPLQPNPPPPTAPTPPPPSPPPPSPSPPPPPPTAPFPPPPGLPPSGNGVPPPPPTQPGGTASIPPSPDAGSIINQPPSSGSGAGGLDGLSGGPGSGQGKEDGAGKKALPIILAVVIPVVAVAGLGAAVLYWARQRQHFNVVSDLLNAPGHADVGAHITPIEVQPSKSMPIAEHHQYSSSNLVWQ